MPGTASAWYHFVFQDGQTGPVNGETASASNDMCFQFDGDNLTE